MPPNFDHAGTNVKSPDSLAHVVLRTNNFQNMVDFYKVFLGATESYGNDFISFLTYDEEHHRIALVNVPGTQAKQRESCGLEHIAFTYKKLEDLALSYKQRQQNGFEPIWCINHGPTTSLYYRDPDGNQIETQVDNFDTAEDATAFFHSKEFHNNPIGTEFHPEVLIKRILSGESEAALKKRVEVGGRGVETVPI